MTRDTKQKVIMPELKKEEENPSGTPDPKKTGASDGAFDPKKLSDDDLVKVLEDPRLWKTDRLSELRAAQKEYKKLKDAQDLAEKAELEKKGEFEKLQTQTQAKLDEANKRIADMEKTTKIVNAAIAKGIQDTDAAAKLIDMSKVAVDEDGNWTGIDEAIEALATARPYLVNSTQSIGNPSNPSGSDNNGGQTYTMSQLGDAKFYQENRDDILLAQREGRITEDRNPNGNN